MGASVSLQGLFSHDMDLDSSILVSSRGYTKINHSGGAVLCIVMVCLFQFHYSSILFGSTWTTPYLFRLHFQDSLTYTRTIFVG